MVYTGWVNLVLFLVLFGSGLTRVDAAAAGRVYAAYGGIYILSTLIWLWSVESIRPESAQISFRDGTVPAAPRSSERCRCTSIHAAGTTNMFKNVELIKPNRMTKAIGA